MKNKMIKILITMVSSTQPWVYALLLGVASMLFPIAPILYTMLFLIISDTITGIIASYYRDNIKFHFFSRESWRHITSSKLATSLYKTLIYFLLVVSAYMFDEHILHVVGHIEPSANWFMRAIVAAIGFREILSILENIETITGGNIVHTILNFIKGGIKGGMISTIEDSEKENKKDKENPPE